MKYTFSTAPKVVTDKTTGAHYSLLPPNSIKAPTTAAKGDDELMSTPAKKS